MPIRLLIADDHALFRQGLKSLLMLQPDIELVGEVERAADLEPALNQAAVDVLLLDLQMDRWMGNDIAEPRRKAFLLGIIEMVLVAEKDHLIFRQRRLDCSNGCLGQIAGEPDIADLGADTAG